MQEEWLCRYLSNSYGITNHHKHIWDWFFGCISRRFEHNHNEPNRHWRQVVALHIPSSGATITVSRHLSTQLCYNMNLRIWYFPVLQATYAPCPFVRQPSEYRVRGILVGSWSREIWATALKFDIAFTPPAKLEIEIGMSTPNIDGSRFCNIFGRVKHCLWAMNDTKYYDENIWLLRQSHIKKINPNSNKFITTHIHAYTAMIYQVPEAFQNSNASLTNICQIRHWIACVSMRVDRSPEAYTALKLMRDLTQTAMCM